MEEKTRKKLSKKTIIAIVIVTVCVAIIAIGAGVGGHATYVRNCEAQILNYSSVFKVDKPQFYTYIYEDTRKEIDFSQIIEVSKGATFSIEKIQDEDATVSKGEGTVLDVSKHSQRLAVIRVVSKNGKGKTDYRITVVPKSAENNVIDFNVSDASIDLDDIVLNYSGEVAVMLPEPKKEYTSLEGRQYSYDFLGWYTSEDFEESTKISRIEKGTSGKISLYARFADVSNAVVQDGYTYVIFGNYPQSQVTDYKEYSAIKNSSEFKNAQNPDPAISSYGVKFNYNGKTYFKFQPKNVPNLSANGFSPNTAYVFNVEPIEWRVLTRQGVTPADGTTVTLLATNILNCSAYSTNDETLMKKLYDSLAKLKIDVNRFKRYFFDGDSMYLTGSKDSTAEMILQTLKLSVKDNALRTTIEGMQNNMFNSTEMNKIQKKTLTSYQLASGNTFTYDCAVWPINYVDAINPNYGFNSDFRYNDPLRKAIVTDFAAANGVYVSTTTAHLGQGSWWLRSAGGDSKKERGDAQSGYGYEDKRIAYVKYTGYVHAYGSLNNAIRSGVRPAINIKYGDVK